MVIITGLGRCGTSILIKYLKEVGVGIGHNVHWHEEARAGLELSTFYSMVDDLYHRYCKQGFKIKLDDKVFGDYWKGRSYREVFKLVDKDHKQGKIEVIKDPRITWHPDIIEAIYEARPDIELFICHRDIKSVMNSRESLSVRYGDPKPRKILQDYQVDFAEFYTRVLKLEIPHKFFFFPDFLKDYYSFYHSLVTSFSIDYDKGEKVFNEIIDKELLNGT